VKRGSYDLRAPNDAKAARPAERREPKAFPLLKEGLKRKENKALKPERFKKAALFFLQKAIFS